MNEADRKAFKLAYEKAELPTFDAGWQAACEWRDSQAGEPRYWVHDFGDEGGGEEFFDHPTGSDCPECVPLYLAPPTAQINQRLVDALQFVIDCQESTNGSDYQSGSALREAANMARAALAATQMRGDA